MAKLINLIPNGNKKKVNEALEDMEVALPARVEKFLERLISTIKSYNLTKKREQAVIARVIDSLGITPSQLTQTVQKLKKYDVVTRKKTGNADHDWMGEAIGDKKLNIDSKLDDAIEQLKLAYKCLDDIRGEMNDKMDRKDIMRSKGYDLAFKMGKDINSMISKLNNTEF
jgi:hypothetical protein